jgi:origin recognition complex subunit 1
MSRVYAVTLPMANLRRSKRFQPAALQPGAQSSTIGATWSGDPIHERPTIREDLFDAERDQWDDDDDEGENDDKELKTIFYGSFSKSNVAARRYQRKGRPRAKTKGGKDRSLREFKVGDAVLIDTGKGSRLPSIGVIVAMWETQGLDNEGGDDEDDDEDEEGGKGMKVKIHWFLRPSQLAGIRAKRDHVEVSLTCSHCNYQ